MIPSEEHKISMFPMDFEEFLWAIGDEVSAETIRYLIKNKKAAGRYKLFNSDVGLFITLAFKDKKYTENIIYNKLLSDKLDVNLGYVYENVVAQMLIAKGNNLFYYTMKSETSNHLYEIDFLTSVKDKKTDFNWQNRTGVCTCSIHCCCTLCDIAKRRYWFWGI